MLFDLLMKPVDSYWKRQYRAEKMRRERAETNQRFAETKLRYQEEDAEKILVKDAAQVKTIDACMKDRQQLLDEIELLHGEIDRMDREMELMRETIRAHRDTIFALKAMGLKTKEADA